MPEPTWHELREYETPDGSRPFRIWFTGIVARDPRTAVRIGKYLERLKQGNFSNAKRLQGCGGVWELIMDFGPGWRVYFGLAGVRVVLLLAGGDKKEQTTDISRAVRYWRAFKGDHRGAP